MTANRNLYYFNYIHHTIEFSILPPPLLLFFNQYILMKFIFAFFVCYLSYSQSKPTVFKSPNSKFDSFELKTYNNLPLLSGSMNEVVKDENGMRVNRTTGFAKYISLLEIKYLNEYYDNLTGHNLKPIKSKSNMYPYREWNKTFEPYFGEFHLRLVIDKLWSNNSKWLYKENAFSPTRGFAWKGKTDIEKVESFQNFVSSQDFSDLRDWAKGVWPNDEIIGYFISKFTVNKYDFSANGLWLRKADGNITMSSTFLTLSHKPKAGFERDYATVLGSSNNQILLEMSIDEAEAFELKMLEYTKINRKQRFLYGVQRVKFHRGFNDNIHERFGPQKEMLFNFVDPNIEIFWDDKLTNRFTEIDLQTVFYKK